MDSVAETNARRPEPGWYGADPTRDELKDDPHDAYRQLRERQPVNLTPQGEWRLSRYADVQELLKHSHGGVRDLNGVIPGETAEASAASRFMLRLDPPDHDRIRNLVNKAFTPRALASIRPAVEPMVEAELDRVTRHGEMDIVADLALAVPAAAMCVMLGVPFDDRHRLARLVSLATYRLAIHAFPHLARECEAAITELAVYMHALIEQRRRRPTDDILGLLVNAEESGDRLSTDELLQQSIGLLIAGLETTIGLIANGMRCFSRHPAQWDRLGANPQLAPLAVDECLRFDPSIPVTRRILWRDTEFGGYVIPANATVFAILIAANRDPQVFSAPDHFDIARREARHCSFGGGIHFCLGSHLARMDAEIAFTAMARRFARVEVDEAAIEWAPSLFRVPGKMPAVLRPRT